MRVSVLSLNAGYLSVGEFSPQVDHNFACGLRGSAQSNPSLRTFRNLREHCQLWSEARILSNKNVKSLSRVRLFATPWTVAYQAPLSMGFSRQ